MKRWINDIRFSRKLATIVIAVFIPVALLIFLFLRTQQAAISAARLEQVGLAAHEPLESVLAPLGEMQFWAMAQATGVASARTKWQQARANTERVMGERLRASGDYGAPAGEDATRWAGIQKEFQALVSMPLTDPVAITQRYEVFSDRILSMNDYVVSSSGLVLDPDRVNYHTVIAATQALPDYMDALADIRADAVALSSGGAAAHWAALDFPRAAGLAANAIEDVKSALEHAAMAGERGQKVHASVAAQLAAVDRSLAAFDAYVRPAMQGGSIDFQKADALSDTMAEDADQLHDQLVAATSTQLRTELAGAERQRNAMLLLILAALVVSASVTYVVTTATTQALGCGAAAVQRLAEGDYTERIEVRGGDEIGRMMQALGQMQEKVSGVLAGVKESAGTVATAAREINASTLDLSQRTEQSAANLEETASSMEEMTATVKQNADNARLANQLAQAARDQAETGGAVVEQAVSAMSAIDGSSKKIADIISVIDEIAFQTNLLALNAAVEAARAGDQGRGFAVVASEVRSLAQRSATAAKEIKDLINDSVAKVEEGGRLVRESGRHLAEIVASVKKVSDVVGEITSASQEQAASAEQISRAVMQMDEGTQQNAAMVEQASAAAASMNEQAAKLQQLTGFFRINAIATLVPAPLGPAATAAVAPRPPPKVAPKPASATRPGAAVAAKGPPEGKERRRAGRPWSGGARDAASAATAAMVSKSASRPAAAEATGDGDWSEF